MPGQSPFEWQKGPPSVDPTDANAIQFGWRDETILEDLVRFWNIIKRCDVKLKCLHADKLDGFHGRHYEVRLNDDDDGDRDEVVDSPNLNNTTPAAPSGDLNIIFQQSGSNISAYVDVSALVALAPLNTYVVGPASATDNAIARYDNTTGKLIQNSSATVDDSGNVAAPNLRNTLHFPPGQQVALADGSVETTFVDEDIFFVYLGRAKAAITAATIICWVTTGYVVGTGGTAPWAEVGILKGDPVLPTGTTVVTEAGYEEVAGTFNTTGIKRTTVALTGVQAGDHLWAAFSSGSDGGTGTPYQLAGGVADALQTGQYADVIGQISTFEADGGGALTDVAADRVPPWIAIYW